MEWEKKLNSTQVKEQPHACALHGPCQFPLGPQGDTVIHLTVDYDDTTVTSTLNNLIKLSNGFLCYANFATFNKNKRKWKDVGTCQR